MHIRVCFARLSQIKLQQLFTGKESIVLKSLPAVVVLYFTASEKDNLRTKSYSYKKQKLSQCTGKLSYVMKNEKNSADYYYLRNRKMILSKYISLLAFYFRESLISAQVCSLGCVICLVHWPRYYARPMRGRCVSDHVVRESF